MKKYFVLLVGLLSFLFIPDLYAASSYYTCVYKTNNNLDIFNAEGTTGGGHYVIEVGMSKTGVKISNIRVCPGCTTQVGMEDIIETNHSEIASIVSGDGGNYSCLNKLYAEKVTSNADPDEKEGSGPQLRTFKIFKDFNYVPNKNVSSWDSNNYRNGNPVLELTLDVAASKASIDQYNKDNPATTTPVTPGDNPGGDTPTPSTTDWTCTYQNANSSKITISKTGDTYKYGSWGNQTLAPDTLIQSLANLKGTIYYREAARRVYLYTTESACTTAGSNCKPATKVSCDQEYSGGDTEDEEELFTCYYSFTEGGDPFYQRVEYWYDNVGELKVNYDTYLDTLSGTVFTAGTEVKTKYDKGECCGNINIEYNMEHNGNIICATGDDPGAYTFDGGGGREDYGIAFNTIDNSSSGDTCASILGTEATEWLNKIFMGVKIIAPLLLIAYSMVDFGKAITSGDEDAKTKATKTVVKRFIVAIIIFLIPTLLKFIMTVTGLIGDCPIS